jgi:hypothetical protein
MGTRKGSVRDADLWNRMVNDKFGGVQPILSEGESLIAARKLYRHAFGKAFPGKVELTKGNRYTWVRRGVLYVNPDKREGHTRGLRSIIHDLSHYAHSRLNPKDAPHSIRQARLEARLAKFALDRGWHEGGLSKPKPEPVEAANWSIASAVEAAAGIKPAEPVQPVEAKPAKAKPDRVAERYRKMAARRDRWKAAAERSTRLLAKAEAEVRTYERRHRDRLGL